MYDALGRVTNFFKWISVSSFFYVTKFLHSSYTFRKGDFPFVDNFFRRIRIYKFRKILTKNRIYYFKLEVSLPGREKGEDLFDPL